MSNEKDAIEVDAGPDAEMQDASVEKPAADTEKSKENTEDEDDKMKEDATESAEGKDGKDKKDDDNDKKDDGKEEQAKAPPKKDYKDWPLRGIKEPHENDVMYGRGGGTNHHPGNKRYRKLVEDRKLDYVNSKRLDKPLVALDIIRVWRAQEPPGRFLKLDEKTQLWHDVGDKKAREKTSQALREKAPLIRKQQEEEKNANDEGDGKGKEDKKGEAGEGKTTRFAEGTKTETKQVKKAVLARDHSLGREYLQAGESVSLEGFSWQDPFQKGSSAQSNTGPTPPHTSPPPPPLRSTPSYPPAGRNSSHGSLGMPPPHHNTSIGAPPPPPDYYGRTTSDDRRRQFSSGRFESWGSPYGCPSPPAGPGHQRSGGWGNGTPPPPQPHGSATHQRSGSWTNGREHSLSHNPLVNASVSQPANQSAFDSSRSASGYWGEPLAATAGNSIPPPPPPPPGPYGGQNGSTGVYRSPRNNSLTPPQNNTPSPPGQYSIDMNIAKTWSGGGGSPEAKTSWSGEQSQLGRTWSRDDNSPIRPGNSTVPRPQMVKRDTSHQNENYETKPLVKKAALNRDNSLASNRLKEKYMPEFYNGKFDTEREMRMLSDNLEQSTLNNARASANTMGGARPKPQPLTTDARESTLDAIAIEMAKPSPLLDGNRTSTIDALDLDLDDDPIIKPLETKRELTMEEEIADLKKVAPKPTALTAGNRLTTVEFMEMINEPIVEDRPIIKTVEPTSADKPIDITRGASIDDWLSKT